MDQSTLKYLRVLIPGLIALLGLYPIYNKYFSNLYKITSLDFSFLTLISLIVGSFYYQLDLQRYIAIPSYYFIWKNIRKRLVKISRLNLTQSQERKLQEEKKYEDVFYYLIDKDESLKRKTANVYFNGIFLTSTADSFLINIFFCFLYKHYLIDIEKSQVYAQLFFIIALLSLILHVVSVSKHMGLANSQLKYIEVHYQQDVHTKINGIL